MGWLVSPWSREFALEARAASSAVVNDTGGGFVIDRWGVKSWRGAFVLVRSHRPGVLSSFSATRLLLWKESGFWFAFGTRPFPSISEAWLSLLRGAAASCWDPGWRAGDGCGGAGPGALCLNSPWPSAFPSLLCSSFPLRWLYPPVVFSALPGQYGSLAKIEIHGGSQLPPSRHGRAALYFPFLVRKLPRGGISLWQRHKALCQCFLCLSPLPFLHGKGNTFLF